MVGQGAETSSKKSKISRSNKPGKHWTARLAAQKLFKDRFEVIHKRRAEEYDGEGIPHLRTFAHALTELLEDLSKDELERCQEMADKWNRETNPKEIQQK